MGSREPKSYIHDLREEHERRQSGMPSQDHEHDRDRRKIVMYVSVGGIMALVVALWVMVLPVQLDKANKNGLKSVFGASDEYKEDKPSLIEEWRAQVDSAQRSIVNLSDGVEFDFAGEATLTEGEEKEGAPPEAGEPPVALDVEMIREKLDASAEPEGDANEETVQQ